MNNLDQIKREYEELLNLPLDSDAVEKRRRGFAFERLLMALFAVDDLEPRAGYRPAGEQIDGSIYLDGRVYLLELNGTPILCQPRRFINSRERWTASSRVRSAFSYRCRDTRRTPSMR